MKTPVQKDQQLSVKSYLVKSQVLQSICLLSLCVIGLLIISTHSFKHYNELNLNLIAQALSDQLQAPLVFDNRVEIKDIIENYMTRYELAEIQLSHPQGEVIYAIEQQQQTSTFAVVKNLQHKLISEKAGQFDVSHNGVVIAKLAIQSNVSPMINFINMLLIIFIACTIFAVIVVWISTTFIDKKLHQSLHVLTEITDDVATRKAFHLRVPKSNISEFNNISNSFNLLLNEIQRWDHQLQQTNSNLEHRVLHDPLTELPNRVYFQQKLQSLLKDPLHQNSFALLFIDNDNFKDINDTYGHQVGDEVLKEMARRLRQSLRHNDFIARLGGDEFAILLTNIHQSEQAVTVASHLLKSSELPLTLQDKTEIHFGFSIGIALSIYARSQDELIHFADLAMYQAKTHQHRKWFLFQNNDQNPS